MINKQKLVSNSHGKIRVAPSKRRILDMTDDVLLKYNALILHGGSSLSSTQRRMVKERVAYAVSKGRIKMDQVIFEVNEISKLIEANAKELQDDNSGNK